MAKTDLKKRADANRCDRDCECTNAEDIEASKDKYPLWGMPYALPGLSDLERHTIVEWLRQGVRIAPKPPMSNQAAGIIGQWEPFLYGHSLQEQHRHANLNKEYLAAKEQYLRELNPDNTENDIEHVCNGNGSTANTLLTIFRHFDSASVVNGFFGNKALSNNSMLFNEKRRRIGSKRIRSPS